MLIPSPAIDPPSRARLTVLVGVYNDDYRTLMSLVLRNQGYQAEEALDGLAVLDYLATRRAPDLLLIDLQLGAGQGVDVIAMIRKMPALTRLPIIALGTDQAHSTLLRDIQVDDFLLKSSAGMTETLLGKINRLCKPQSLL